MVNEALGGTMEKIILLEAMITEREGMLAENTHGLDCGQGITYGDEAFQKLADQMRELASQLTVKADAEPRVEVELCGDCRRKASAAFISSIHIA